jgi:xylulokinase
VPDLPDATGSLHGIRPGLLEPGSLFRAALEGVALNLAWGIESLRRLHVPVATLRLVGGGARNRLWAGILADAIGVPVQPLAETETAALGAALQAAWTVLRMRDPRASIDELAQRFVRPAGAALEPDAGRARLYAELGRRFRRLAGAAANSAPLA